MRKLVVPALVALSALFVAPQASAQQDAAAPEIIVVGTRAVEVAEEGPAALEAYVRSLRKSIDA